MRPLIFLCALFTVVLLAEQSSGVNYMWLTDSELTPFGEVSRFWGHDTLWGPVRTNGCFSVQNVNGLPVFFDSVFMGCANVNGPNPIFLIPPVYEADSVPFPDSASWIREQATIEGYYFNFDALGHEARAVLDWTALYLYHWQEGVAFDSALADLELIPLLDDPVVFVEGKLEAYGTIDPQGYSLILAASEDIRILDNLMIEGTNTNNGAVPQGATSRIALVSEQNVMVANTWENGRENCSQGCHVVITALIFALNGVMGFEQMNDVWDPYISPIAPDERGNCVLTGGVTQRMRGYMHRSNRGGTGYGKLYHYDNRLRNWPVGVFGPYTDIEQDTVFSDTDDRVVLQPSSFSLSAYPNPFNAQTTISFDLPETGNVKLELFDLAGRNVTTLLEDRMSSGSHTLNYNATSLPSGVYFLSLDALGNQITQKLLLLK